MERASAGVEVIFVYDEIGSSGLGKGYLDDLRTARDRIWNREVTDMFEADFAHATPIDLAGLANKPWYWQFGVNLSRLLAPVL